MVIMKMKMVYKNKKKIIEWWWWLCKSQGDDDEEDEKYNDGGNDEWEADGEDHNADAHNEYVDDWKNMKITLMKCKKMMIRMTMTGHMMKMMTTVVMI